MDLPRAVRESETLAPASLRSSSLRSSFSRSARPSSSYRVPALVQLTGNGHLLALTVRHVGRAELARPPRPAPGGRLSPFDGAASRDGASAQAGAEDGQPAAPPARTVGKTNPLIPKKTPPPRPTRTGARRAPDEEVERARRGRRGGQ